MPHKGNPTASAVGGCQIRYVEGDATHPDGDDGKIVAHVCNDVGGWGRGFVVALSNRWSEPERAYRAWAESLGPENLPLGHVQFVPTATDGIVVANMVAQHDIRTIEGVPPIRYRDLRTALIKVGRRALETGASVHMPRIGSGLAGGRWSVIEPLIDEAMTDHGVSVTVYDLPGAKTWKS